MLALVHITLKFILDTLKKSHFLVICILFLDHTPSTIGSTIIYAITGEYHTVIAVMQNARAQLERSGHRRRGQGCDRSLRHLHFPAVSTQHCTSSFSGVILALSETLLDCE